jgi:putative aldouronate transport system permease protein
MSKVTKKQKTNATPKQKLLAFGRYMRARWQYYILILPAFVFTAIFSYQPMYGLQIAFRDYKTKKGFWGSKWVGLKHFERFLESDKFLPLLRNTLEINLVTMVCTLIIPIIVALMLNELNKKKMKKTMQMIMYAPHFVSTMALCGIVILFTNREAGIINVIIKLFGGEGVDFLSKPANFTAIYVLSEIWQNTGWGTIIYLATLSGVDQQIVEAALIDGANRYQKIWHVDIPCIMPTIITMAIMKAGHMLSLGYEKILLLQTPLNIEKAEVISSYVYEIGIQQGQFSYSTAIGLFNSIVNIIVLFLVNTLAKKRTGTSLW